MSSSISETLRDETLRIEIGAAARSELAVENVALATGDLSPAARGSVIVRRAGGNPGAEANRLAMHEVQLPPRVVPALERFAA